MIADPKANVHQIEVVEMYPTVEGEGALVGTPLMLLRLWGCPFSCKFCDSRYAWDVTASIPETELFPSGESVVQRIGEVERARGFEKHLWVSITGGDPMGRSPTELVDLCLALVNDNRKIMMQTTGTIHRPQLFGFVNFWSISPPLDSSGQSVLGHAHLMRNVEKLLIEARNVTLAGEATPKGQLKFVVSSEVDVAEAVQLYEDWAQYHGDKIPVIFQPVQWPDEGIDTVMSRFERLVNIAAIRAIPNVRVIPQVHKMMFLQERGNTP